MRKLILTIMLVIISACAAMAQTQTTTSAGADASSASSVRRDGKTLNIASGTRLAAQLQNTLDVRKAKVGDTVVLKTTEAIKENGRTVVNKGARLVGRVTEVQQRTRGEGESRVSLLFDRLESGSLVAPINATITSITQLNAGARRSDDDQMMTDTRSTTSARSNTSQPQRSNNGGLVGGVTGAVGSVVGSTTDTVGGAVGGTTQTVGNTAGNVTRNVGGIRISQSASASADGGTTLSLAGDNLRLEKGTTFRLTLNEAANVGGEQ
jgi:hypothetical protein